MVPWVKPLPALLDPKSEHGFQFQQLYLLQCSPLPACLQRPCDGGQTAWASATRISHMSSPDGFRARSPCGRGYGRQAPGSFPEDEAQGTQPVSALELGRPARGMGGKEEESEGACGRLRSRLTARGARCRVPARGPRWVAPRARATPLGPASCLGGGPGRSGQPPAATLLSPAYSRLSRRGRSGAPAACGPRSWLAGSWERGAEELAKAAQPRRFEVSQHPCAPGLRPRRQGASATRAGVAPSRRRDLGIRAAGMWELGVARR